jgi:hypothetical protein
MASKSILQRMALVGGWSRELVLAALALGLGLALMPLLIFYAGTASLGPYEGATLSGMYGNIYRGLTSGSPASWIVVLGPFGFYLLFKVLRIWWRGARAA